MRKYPKLNNTGVCLSHTTSWVDNTLWPGNIPSLCHNHYCYFYYQYRYYMQREIARQLPKTEPLKHDVFAFLNLT